MILPAHHVNSILELTPMTVLMNQLSCNSVACLGICITQGGSAIFYNILGISENLKILFKLWKYLISHAM